MPYIKLEVIKRERVNLPLPFLFLLAAALLLLLGCTPGRFSQTSNGWSPAAGADGTIYVVTKQGSIRAIADENREELWEFRPNGNKHEEDRGFHGAYGSPVISDELVYVGAIDGVLYALDRETGTIGDTGWKYPLGLVEDERPYLVGEPALDLESNVVVVGSEDGNLYAFDAKTGEVREGFPFKAQDKIWSAPVIQDGVIYFGSHDKHIYAVSLEDGTEKWKAETGGVVAGRPLVFRDMVIAGSFDKKLYALNIKDGSKIWEFPRDIPGDNWFWAGAVANGRTIFAPSMDGHVYALDRSGNLAWKIDLESPIVSRPVLVPRGLVVAGKDGTISLLDTSLAEVGTSRVRNSFALSGDPEILAPLTASDETVLVSALDNTVRRIGVRAGLVAMWCFHTEDDQCN